MTLAGLCWPAARAGEALAALVEAAGLEPRRDAVGAPPDDDLDDAWLVDAARWLGVEAQPVTAEVPDVATMLRWGAPALVKVEGGVLAVVGATRRTLAVLAPDGARVRIALAEVARALTAPADARVAEELAAIADTAGVRGRRRARLLAGLRTTRLRHDRVLGVVMIRRAVEAPLRTQARDLRLGSRLAGLAGLHLVGYLLMLAGWWAIGRTILSGRGDRGWLTAWALLVATSLGVRLAAAWAAGPLAIEASVALRQRLINGALRLPADRVRGDGVGRALGRVFEAHALEGLAVDGGFTALFAVLELVVVAVVLALGAGGWLHVALLALTVAVAAAGVRRYVGARRTWTDERLAITHELVEALAGHATRLAQEPPDARHAAEDHALARYLRRSEQLDRRLAWLQAAVPRGWLVLASAGLAPALLLHGADVPGLAIALGGILLGHRALTRLADGATRLTDASVAWRSVAPLVTAGGELPVLGAPTLAHAAPSPGQPLATVRAVVYRPARSATPLLAGCELVIRDGERIVLGGRSGAGKSTLASVLAGLRQPDGGLVLAGGLDRATLGERGWRRRIALVPQFHDNHVFVGSLAWNLLMARVWPPSPADLAEAEAVCRDLGLWPTIERMPGGLFQLVGETGWQLSHGEKSRIYLARALLSRAPLVILDESLAALDPDTLVEAMACVECRARAALVVAHP